MRRILWLLTVLGFLSVAATSAERVELVYWTHWCENNEVFENFWAEAAARFDALHPEVDFSIRVVCIPYSGYEAKYRAAFEAGAGPDMFNDMPSAAVDVYKAAEPLPQDIAQLCEQLIVETARYGKYQGTWYGLPVEGGNFQALYINTDMFVEAGLDPNTPPSTMTELLQYAQKLTVYDDKGNILRQGFGVRYSGHPFGIADKALPFIHAFGGYLFSWDEKKATGYMDSPETTAGVQFLVDLVQKYRVASLEFGNPETAFAQGLGAMMFRESWAAGWLDRTAPNIHYKIYPLPGEVAPAGYTCLFPWCIMVNKNAPEVKRQWAWEFIRWYLNNPDLRVEHYTASGILPPYLDILPKYASHPFYEAMMAMASQPPAPRYDCPAQQDIMQIFGAAVANALYGRVSVDEALSAAARQADEVLARYAKQGG